MPELNSTEVVYVNPEIIQLSYGIEQANTYLLISDRYTVVLVSGSALALNRAAPLDEAALPDETAFSSLPAVLAALPCVLKTIRVFRKENRLQFIWKIDFDFPSQTYLQSGSAMLQ